MCPHTSLSCPHTTVVSWCWCAGTCPAVRLAGRCPPTGLSWPQTTCHAVRLPGLEPWLHGTVALEPWNLGALTPDHWDLGTMEHWNLSSWTLGASNLGTLAPEFWDPGPVVPLLQITGALKHWNTVHVFVLLLALYVCTPLGAFKSGGGGAHFLLCFEFPASPAPIQYT